MTDARIRKVKALKGIAKVLAEKRGLKLDDLVIVRVRGRLTSIEKIDGDPVSYLLNRANDGEMRLTRRIEDLEREMIPLMRFYLAFRISQCPNCNVKVSSWESPIVFTGPKYGGYCINHEKEIDEFNRRHASD